MAVSSCLSSSLPPLPFQAPSRPSIRFSSLHNLRRASSVASAASVAAPPRPRSVLAFAAPEALETPSETLDGGEDSFEVDTPGSSPLAVDSDYDKMALKQKIRIKLRSYWVPLIEDSCKQIMDAARTSNAKTMGPVPLPTKKRIYCVLKSPHVHKDARFHFEIRTHQRLIDILNPTSQTIDSLMQLDLPAGVDVDIKL
ncbi:hypothetical protein QJS10_CPA10g01815 [Acorus calamus]|uniref:Small ribosomal subunit protein uS10c n=1 Tax=Acorus calamus TaxID=4465 RepID=A0AAV9E3J5_ACOCL|nr:hypothetical protein QJS10_CPA10g01815 [Acorus calamus]